MAKVPGTLIVDRFCSAAMRYPGNYGFIPPALSGDGNPWCVLIANQRSIDPGVPVAVRRIGLLEMRGVSRRRGEDHRSAQHPASSAAPPG